VTLLFKFLPAITVLALLFGVISSLYMFRARSMRGLAARWAFQYVGPRAPNFWGFRSFPKTRLSLPVSFPRAGYPAGEIRQVWNVIEGQQNGFSVLVFDSVLGAGRGVYCTVIACQTKQNPFGRDTSSGRVNFPESDLQPVQPSLYGTRVVPQGRPNCCRRSKMQPAIDLFEGDT
jgi:hypothetical protein